VVVSVVAYFFCVISVFATIMAFMTLLVGNFDNSTFEKLRHYPRPIIERTVAPAPPNNELHHIPNVKSHVTLRTNEVTPPKDLSAHYKNTKDSRAASIAKADADKPKPEGKIRSERLAHLRQPKVLARQRQNYEGHGHTMALGYAEGRSVLEDLNGQR
jgi:hypothetical protein